MSVINVINDYFFVFEMLMLICWGDMDVFGYVNNMVYFCYMEQVWILWFEQFGIVGGNGEGQGFVIVIVLMEFFKQLYYLGDVIVKMLVVKFG